MSNGCDCALHKSPGWRDAWKVRLFGFLALNPSMKSNASSCAFPKCTYSNVSIYSTYKAVKEYRELDHCKLNKCSFKHGSVNRTILTLRYTVPLRTNGKGALGEPRTHVVGVLFPIHFSAPRLFCVVHRLNLGNNRDIRYSCAHRGMRKSIRQLHWCCDTFSQVKILYTMHHSPKLRSGETIVHIARQIVAVRADVDLAPRVIQQLRAVLHKLCVDKASLVVFLLGPRVRELNGQPLYVSASVGRFAA
jgi:hypothetical protein